MKYGGYGHPRDKVFSIVQAIVGYMCSRFPFLYVVEHEKLFNFMQAAGLELAGLTLWNFQ